LKELPPLRRKPAAAMLDSMQLVRECATRRQRQVNEKQP
jgi:hypothetical protein